MNGAIAVTPREQLRASILRSVSRSFYLSIRLLPSPVRDPIALAYLLARTTDTLADTVEVPAPLRMQHLADLAEIIQRRRTPAETIAIGESFAPLQTDASERALIAALPDCIAWLQAIDEADRADIKRVLAHINKGQALDVQRFADPATITALETAADLEEYKFLVAGCVGEFWTRVCFRRVPGFSDRAAGEMESFGVQYGKALQLINILRDIGADLRAGRCYLPAEQLRSLGVAPADIAGQPERIEPLLRQWHEVAAEGLEAGLDYACAVRPWRVRLATALPALIGIRTLALLRAAGATAVTHRIKVSRPDVRRILVTTIASLASPKALRRTFDRYRK